MLSISALVHIDQVWHIIYGQFDNDNVLNGIIQEVKSIMGIDYSNFSKSV